MEASHIMHERALYDMRDWYMRQHRLIRLEKDGSDHELLKASLDHIFPRKNFNFQLKERNTLL